MDKRQVFGRLEPFAGQLEQPPVDLDGYDPARGPAEPFRQEPRARADLKDDLIARDLGRADETVTTLPLRNLSTEGIDMTTVVLVGSSETRRMARGDGSVRVYTPRGYAGKQAKESGG